MCVHDGLNSKFSLPSGSVHLRRKLITGLLPAASSLLSIHQLSLSSKFYQSKYMYVLPSATVLSFESESRKNIRTCGHDLPSKFYLCSLIVCVCRSKYKMPCVYENITYIW
ncbi:hypothetical protein FRX31_002817, partial [Thalictrum thalictroides]